ncbi:hypothetical protein [Janthinobacterium sp. ZB1P44]|uniref:hypothetical protein n=1 Tax=Janthinobacterium sp. ZB1P44 TaxID=3424192 RepID=UPI003F253E5B
MNQNFISLLDAAKSLAGSNAAEVEMWLALLTEGAQEGRLSCVKSWTEHRSTLPGGISFIRPPGEWRVLRTTLKTWMEAEKVLDGTPPTGARPEFPTAQGAIKSVTPAAVLPEQTDDAVLSRREMQIRAIEAAAAAQGYDVVSIPTGGKTILRNQCRESNRVLFGGGSDPFNDAWKVAITSSPPRLRMADHNKFSGK